jgi:hypothetical protein
MLQKIRPRNPDTSAGREHEPDFAIGDMANGLHLARVYVGSSITVPACGKKPEPSQAAAVSRQGHA